MNNQFALAAIIYLVLLLLLVRTLRRTGLFPRTTWLYARTLTGENLALVLAMLEAVQVIVHFFPLNNAPSYVGGMAGGFAISFSLSIWRKTMPIVGLLALVAW